jgi:hypothetical protein
MATGLINTVTFADFVSNAEIKWRERYEAFPKVAGALYDIDDVDVTTGDESSFDNYSVARKKEEGQDFANLSVNQGYKLAWSIYEVGGMTKITWKMRRGNKYREMDESISGLAESAAKRMEWDLTHRFTFAFATSYTDIDGDTVTTTIGDGLALMSASHTVNGSSTTFRNAIANNPPLSKSGLEAGEKLFATQMIDNNGELIFENPDTLITTNDPTVVNTALEYLHSYGDVDGAHEGIYNAYMGKYRLIVLPYLSTTAAGAYDSTKANYWFLANLRKTDAMAKILERPTFIPPTENDGKEFETMDWKFACHAAYALLILRANWLVGSKGDSTA